MKKPFETVFTFLEENSSKLYLNKNQVKSALEFLIKIIDLEDLHVELLIF